MFHCKYTRHEQRLMTRVFLVATFGFYTFLAAQNCLALEPMASVNFLGLTVADDGAEAVLAEEGTAGTAAVAATVEATGPWSRLSVVHRRRIQPVLEAQLHVASSDEGKVCLAQQEYAADYQRFRAAGLADQQWPQFLFNESFDAPTRRVFLCVYAKMVDEGIWPEIKTIKHFSADSPWPGFYVMPHHGGPAFKTILESKGYGNWFKAARPPRWGLRSPKTGYQFHIIQCPLAWDQRFIEMHIDSYNPGTSDTGIGWVAPGVELGVNGYKGLKHVVDDNWWPDEEDVPRRLKAALRGQGLIVPDVDQTHVGKGIVMSDFLKWDTGDAHFGYLWLNLRTKQAGWWTTYEGARNFTSVRSLGQHNPWPVSFRLEYYNGFLLFRITGPDSCEASWYKKNERRWIDVEGELVSGHIYE